MTHYGCPKCNNKNIVEINTVYAEYPVSAWDENGQPEDYAAAEVLWDTSTVADDPRYRCRDCNHFFDEPKVLQTA